MAVAVLATRAGIGSGAPDLLPQRGKQRLDVDVLCRREAVVRRLVRHRASVTLGLPAKRDSAGAESRRLIPA
jgi:hypothetical protein